MASHKGLSHFQVGNVETSVSADDRYTRRQTEVKPLVEAFFQFIDTFDVEDPSGSDKLKDAVLYSRVHKEELCLFLTDGNIPIDNGYCERLIKPIARTRKSSLFSTSLDGAEANVTLHTLVETAKLNKANPYYYLMYVVTQMMTHLEDTDRSFLENLMPWSDAYRQYEEKERKRTPRELIPISQEKPPRRSPNRQTA